MIMMMILIIVSLIVIIILCFIVITVTGDVGSRPCYKGAWSIRLLCSAYTLVGSGNYDDEDDDMMMMVMMMVMMIMMVMMVMMNKIRMTMIIMTMMMMTQTDVFQESSNSPSSLSFRSRTLYKFQPDLSAGDFLSSCLYFMLKKLNTSIWINCHHNNTEGGESDPLTVLNMVMLTGFNKVQQCSS